MRSVPVAIIGGGLAGSAAAIVLARAGAAVTLFERETAPIHKVCGEFLSEEALEIIAALGVDLDVLEAPPIDTLRVAHGHATFQIALPFQARSFTRHALDEALLQAAERAGAVVERGAHVTGLTAESQGWRIKIRGRDDMRTEQVILATGKHDLAGLPRLAGKQSDLVGMKMYFRLAPSQREHLCNAIELHLFGGGYAGLQLVEDGSANLCCAVKTSRLASGANRWPTLLEAMQRASPSLRERLEGAVELLPKPMAIAPIPYGLMQRSTQLRLWLVGDQAAVIPSFTGDGMSMALYSGVLAAAALLAGEDARNFQRNYARAVEPQVRFATLLSRAMVHAPLQRCMASAIRVRPSLLPWIAKRTRLPLKVRTESAAALRS